MGLFDAILGGDKTERSMRLAGIGDVLMNLDQGRSADISPYVNAIGERRQDTAFQQQLQDGSVAGLDKFSPEERSFLTQLPRSVAQKMIAERLFAKPEPTKFGWQTMPDGTLIRSDSAGGFQQMGQFGKAAGADQPSSFVALDLQAQAAGLAPGSPEYQQFMLAGGKPGGGEGPAAFQALHMQAEAAGFPQGTPEYQQFMATRGAGLVEAAKTEAKGTAEARAQLPGARQMAADVSKQVDDLLADPYLDSMLGPVNSRLPNVSSDAARVRARMDQLQGGAFLQARQLLKGGGAITDFEGQKAEAAFLRMNAAQSRKDYELALREFQEAVMSGVKKLEEAMAGPKTSAPSDDDLLSKYGLK